MQEENIDLTLKDLRNIINNQYYSNERDAILYLTEEAKLNDKQYDQIEEQATILVEIIRRMRKRSAGIDSFLTEYSLSSEEGVALMCLAEAFLRVPDNKTIDRLIKDKLVGANWKSHKGQSSSFFVNATTWALMLTGKVLKENDKENRLSKTIKGFVNRTSEPMIRKAVKQAMRIMSKQFVMGRTIEEAVDRARVNEEKGYLYSYDMLGEAALTAKDAKTYFDEYMYAIETIGKNSKSNKSIYQRPGVSVKLSALHPRYEESQKDKTLAELTKTLLSLALVAKKYDIALTIDAEESERLDLSLDVIEAVFSDKSLSGWNGLGLAVQSYQKRAFFLIDWVAKLAQKHGKRMMVRLIKGAYWDSEIKKAQMEGFKDYPVFTRKCFTDVSFQACAKKLFGLTHLIYPQFATHNAYSVALILNIAGDYKDFEFQCLHGMGTELYDQIVPKDKENIPCRVYAPVGSHEDLLPYLVRRLLENGANSSFVNRIVDETAPVSQLVSNPISVAKQYIEKINNNIPLPRDIFEPKRLNSLGINLADREVRALIGPEILRLTEMKWKATPIVDTNKPYKDLRPVFSPQDKRRLIGHVCEADKDDIEIALSNANEHYKVWSMGCVKDRANCLEKIADLYEKEMLTFVAILCLEGGKTWHDGVAEVREAVDFCRYYAMVARGLMDKPLVLKGYTGEKDELSYHPRGTVLCISPWNFPLAIFTGQIVAALVTGNCVIAKPAEQTSLIAHYAIKQMIKAGIPKGVIQMLPGGGGSVGAPLVNDHRVKAVMFTGSTDTANFINKTLANRGGSIIPLIAETGGQNAMIIDSSALLEQVIVDVIVSAFGSAGQRCSALRVCYVQEEIYQRFKDMLVGAMDELIMSDPVDFKTDVGPVIDQSALNVLRKHSKDMAKQHELLYQCRLGNNCNHGYFMPPTAFEINSITALKKEVFGPILHVIKYSSNQLDDVIDDINNTGYGLTMGIHSRINEKVEYIRERIHVGNCYVNRNMTGAIVGLQPFGGEGLSGTGPKAGGPNYLLRLLHERCFTVDTTAAGGNASLMSLSDEL